MRFNCKETCKNKYSVRVIANYNQCSKIDKNGMGNTLTFFQHLFILEICCHADFFIVMLISDLSFLNFYNFHFKTLYDFNNP